MTLDAKILRAEGQIRPMKASRLKQWLKGFPLLVRIIRYVRRRFFAPPVSLDISELNVLTTFRQFTPNSAGCYKDRADIAIRTINRTFPCLSSLALSVKQRPLSIRPITSFLQSGDDLATAEKLRELFDVCGSDKTTHGYHNFYGPILKDRDAITGVLEIGIGTHHKDVVSYMGANWTPGASLRAFREFLCNAQIYGADIDKRILFEENRIKTLFVDQTRYDSFEALNQFIPADLDLVVDDGLHSPDANIATLQFGLSKVKTGGWVVIEDIAPEAQVIWEVVAAILPANLDIYLLSAEGGLVFAVKRLS